MEEIEDLWVRTCHGTRVVSLYTHVAFLIAPDLAEQVRCSDVTLASPGVDVGDRLRVFAHVEKTSQDEVVHALRTHLQNYTKVIKIYTKMLLFYV